MTSSQVQPKRRGRDISKLTDRQRIFVHEYLADDKFNARAAAKKAGYKNPSDASMKLLSNKVVVGYLGKKLQERMDTCDVTAERVLRELCCIGFSNPKNLFDEDGTMLDISQMDDNTARSIQSVKTKVTTDSDGNTHTTAEVRFWNKNDALQLIAKHLGMLDDRIKMDHGVDDNFLSALLGQIEADRKDVIDAKYIEAKVGEE